MRINLAILGLHLVINQFTSHILISGNIPLCNIIYIYRLHIYIYTYTTIYNTHNIYIGFTNPVNHCYLWRTPAIYGAPSCFMWPFASPLTLNGWVSRTKPICWDLSGLGSPENQWSANRYPATIVDHVLTETLYRYRYPLHYFLFVKSVRRVVNL